MPQRTPTDRHSLALLSLAATLSDERRARRFLDLSGIGIEELRARAGEPAILAALIGFLEAYEPDLLDVAAKIGVEPQELVEARRRLEDEQ